MAPRVPWSPEPLASLQARYPAAVTDLIDQQDVADERRPSPSGEAKHVFDTEDGLRLIINCERLLDGRVGIHISASLHHNPPKKLDIRETWRSIAQSTLEPKLIFISAGGIPHYFLERVN